jgi:DNA polymerase III gamma/tau subunit
MLRIEPLIKTALAVSLICVAILSAGCVRPTPPAQETTSSSHEQTKPPVLPVTQSPDTEMRAEPAKMHSNETVASSETPTTAVAEKPDESAALEQSKKEPVAPKLVPVESKKPINQSKEVALNTKHQIEKKPAAQVATPAIAKIEISPRSHSLNPCEQKKFSAAVKDNSGRQIKEAEVAWESTDPKIATVNKNGVVMGVSPGFTFIRAVNGKIKSNSSSLFVRDKQADRGC